MPNTATIEYCAAEVQIGRWHLCCCCYCCYTTQFNPQTTSSSPIHMSFAASQTYDPNVPGLLDAYTCDESTHIAKHVRPSHGLCVVREVFSALTLSINIWSLQRFPQSECGSHIFYWHIGSNDGGQLNSLLPTARACDYMGSYICGPDGYSCCWI